MHLNGIKMHFIDIFFGQTKYNDYFRTVKTNNIYKKSKTKNLKCC